MKLTFRNAALPFGQRVRATFIAGDNERASSVYTFITGPSAEIERTNDNAESNGVWSLKFDGSAKIHFERGVYHFRTATVIQKGMEYEMFITVMYCDTPTGERLIYTIKEL